MLVLNSFITEAVPYEERTAELERLTCIYDVRLSAGFPNTQHRFGNVWHQSAFPAYLGPVLVLDCICHFLPSCCPSYRTKRRFRYKEVKPETLVRTAPGGGSRCTRILEVFYLSSLAFRRDAFLWKGRDAVADEAAIPKDVDFSVYLFRMSCEALPRVRRFASTLR